MVIMSAQTVIISYLIKFTCFPKEHSVKFGYDIITDTSVFIRSMYIYYFCKQRSVYYRKNRHLFLCTVILLLLAVFQYSNDLNVFDTPMTISYYIINR